MELPKEIKLLADQLNLTNLEEAEPYILTKDEEDGIVANAVLESKRHITWKLKGLAYTDQQILDKLKDIDWDAEINREELLKRCNSNKIYEQWQKEQREKDKQEAIRKQKELQDKYTAKAMFSLMKWTSDKIYGKPLIVNNDNKRLITALCFFLSNDTRFETELGYSLKKGLLIRGISGLGKTHLVRCVEKNELNPILVLSMIDIADQMAKEGEYQINLFNCKIVYLDDVGTEEATVNHYGTKMNFFKDFIEMVYLKNKIFNKLMISTNNSFFELEEKYGFRVRSRIKDMFNIIDVTGKDMRG